MSAPIETVRLRITGRVQGVGYRLWVTRTAASLGVRGWVRNRTDGSVEALVTGAPEAVVFTTSWPSAFTSCACAPTSPRIS